MCALLITYQGDNQDDKDDKENRNGKDKSYINNLSALDIIDKIQNGEISPRLLSQERRRAVVQVLYEGCGAVSSIAEIARFLKRSEKTIERDLIEIRKSYLTDLTGIGWKNFLSELLQDYKIAKTFLRRFISSPGIDIKLRMQAIAIYSKICTDGLTMITGANPSIEAKDWFLPSQSNNLHQAIIIKGSMQKSIAGSTGKSTVDAFKKVVQDLAAAASEKARSARQAAKVAIDNTKVKAGNPASVAAKDTAVAKAKMESEKSLKFGKLLQEMDQILKELGVDGQSPA